MQLTIHTHHELSEEAKQIIQGFARAHMRDDIDQAHSLEHDLEGLGFLIVSKVLHFETEQVDVYISKVESLHPEACTCDECAAIRFAYCGYED